MKVDELQDAFAKAIRQPLVNNHLKDTEISTEAASVIVPSPTLKPFQRLEIYAQQYWWRLFSTLQEQFPLVTRLFGYDGFNEFIVTPYIQKYPPMDWNLNFLGKKLLDWIYEDYEASDKPLIYAAAELDWSFIKATLEKNDPLPSSEKEILYLAAPISLLSSKWDLLPFRKEMLTKDPNHWVENDFPPLKKENGPYSLLIRRTSNNLIAVDRLTPKEFALLQQFTCGVSLKDLRETNYEWVNKWIKQRVLTPEKKIL